MKRTFLTGLTAFALTSMLGAGSALAASFDVSVNNDDGSGGTSGTLSWAIRQANLAGPVSHSITLKSDVTLTARMRQLIEQSVTIQADSSARQITCNAGSGGQPFFIGGGLAGSTTSGVTVAAAGNSAMVGKTLTNFAVSGLVAGTAYDLYLVANETQTGFASQLVGPVQFSTVAIATRSVVIDPAATTTLYAGIEGAGVYKSSNSGGNWTAAANQPGNLQVKALAIKPGDSSTLYAATYGGGVFKSSDSGANWNVACASQPANLNLLSLVMDASGKLYAGSEAGVFVSTVGCASWAPMNTGMP